MLVYTERSTRAVILALHSPVMTQEQFTQLVQQLEKYSRRNPLQYKLRVTLLAFAGYSYIFLVLGATIGLVVGLLYLILEGSTGARGVMAKIMIGLVIFSALILRSLWVRMEAPAGIELPRRHFPRLSKLVDKLTSLLRAPRFHHVLLTDDFNAAVAQVPRLGFLGWHRNYLLLGLPLMQALSPKQFQAVLAHELGHLSRQHGRISGWIYRVRQTWGRLLERLKARHHWGSVIFERFLDWYMPFFNAYSFVLARAHEYEADRRAAILIGHKPASETLASVEVIGRFQSEVLWPTVYKAANHEPEPPVAPFSGIAQSMKMGLPADQAQRWLEQALSQPTGYDDTHPSLLDRLTALGPVVRSWNQLAASLEVTAAEQYLGPALEKLTTRVNRQWQKAVALGWSERYQAAQAARRRLQTLEEKALHEPLTIDELWERAHLTDEFNDEDLAIPFLKELLTAEPGHGGANYVMGRILLGRDSADGVRHIEVAIEQQSDAIIPGCQLAAAFFDRQGNAAESQRFMQRAQEYYDLLARAQEERQLVKPADQFEPHGLPLESVDQVRGQLVRYPQVVAAYLVRKNVTLLKEKPCYILAVAPRYKWYESKPLRVDEELVKTLSAELVLPEDTYVIALGYGMKRRWERALRKIPNSHIDLSHKRTAPKAAKTARQPAPREEVGVKSN